MRVADHEALASWKDRLEAKGVTVEGPVDHGMFRSIYFHDPNGYRLEFASVEEKEEKVFADHAAKAPDLLRNWNAWKSTRKSEVVKSP